MYEIKTKENEKNIMQFIDKIENISRREDARKLLHLFTETTGLEARMWGDSMIGFGSYHYKYDSGHEGDAMITGFSPRKAKISLYLTTDTKVRETLLAKLGKHTEGKVCVYINALSDINENVLKDLINQNVMFMREIYSQNSMTEITNKKSINSNERKIDEVDCYITQLPNAVQSIVSALREIILDTSFELIEEFKWSMPNYSYQGLVCYIQAYKKHVNLGFHRGDKLQMEDINMLLQGAGKAMRHIRIDKIEDIKTEEFNLLIQAAIALNKST